MPEKESSGHYISGNFELNNPEMKDILDMCCGARMFWFGRDRSDVVYADIRSESHDLTNGQHIDVAPDVRCDFRDLPFSDGRFSMVIFDPPHLERLGGSSDLAKKYGRLFPGWEDDIQQGFSEGFRVLRDDGFLVFKWCEVDVPLKRVLALTDRDPMFGHTGGRQSNTHWVMFRK